MSNRHRITDPSHPDYTPLMAPDDLIIVTVYVDLDSFQLQMYAIGQGNMYKYSGDEETLTITIKRSEQVGEEGDEMYTTESMLEDFEDTFGHLHPDDIDVDDHGIASFSMIKTFKALPEV